ncbi:MAG: phospholipase C, phosphocholine-specific [Chitinophagaceae bacterium]|nr:phospholipase C, phosphocholine-specific [Chitinophagaceae bacterium]
MDSRREFLKKASLLSGGAGLLNVLPTSIAKALAIDPLPGSTFYDAEHIVFLMQENRSFDHTYGTLQGVRGFNDPRAIYLPGKNVVWCQPDGNGEIYAPFRLDIKNTNATWMESLPHGWTDQVDARNNGKYNKWLDVKRSGVEEYKAMPLTLGFYTREDIPFYYSMADAFTVCDHNFCSSLTGTTPNRLYFWTGTIREKQDPAVLARVWNDDADYNTPVQWKTFPERLEENNISWKVYQNEIGAGSGLKDELDSWLGNFGDNPLEYFSQFKAGAKPGELSGVTKSINERAFTTNKKDPHYHELTTLKYNDQGTERKVQVPKGDLFYQFREDVKNGQLPTVSWLVAPQQFSDHPSAAWYGAWYISEALDILTQNPEVWKKTIFILTYDENDGYFDHVPPFVVPHPDKKETGAVSQGINAGLEYVASSTQQTSQQEDARIAPIGLGYRVPMVIASPWSRGGWVNSQVFDHTSSIQFLEKFLSKKFKKKIHEPNISEWRRAVCGDLTSAFRKYNGEELAKPQFLQRDEFIEAIHKARFRNPPSNFRKLSKEDAEKVTKDAAYNNILPEQEKGIRDANALPYELYTDGKLSADKATFSIGMRAGNKMHGAHSAGSPFNVYAPGKYKGEEVSVSSYAVKAGDTLTENFALNDFENGVYHLRVYGPNGFYREFRGSKSDPELDITCDYYKGTLRLRFTNKSDREIVVNLTDNSYGAATFSPKIAARSGVSSYIDVSKSHGWYDLSVQMDGNEVFRHTLAGRLENGKPGKTDPLMGRTL